MMIKTILVLAIVCACFCGKVPIQSHSFNDVGYIQNLISRGVDNFKLDASLANHRSCQQHSTWNSTQNCITTAEYIEQICCLAMKGDGSSRPEFSYPFNTSVDFTNMLQRTMAKIVTYEPNRRILFAIDIQFHHTFNNSLAENFYLSLANLLEKYPKNLFICIGSDILQYDRICFGQGQSECTNTRRKISKASFFMQSGSMNPFDPRDHYQRYRNFNTFYKSIDQLCEKGFPIWINKYPEFPLIFWEPSNEQQIQKVINKFLSPSCVAKHNRNISGLAIATNLDPEMVDIYMKRTIDTASLVEKSNLDSEQSASPSWLPLTEKLLVSEQVNLRLTKMKVGSYEIVFSVSSNVLTNKLLLQKWELDEKTKSMRQTASRELTILMNSETIERLLQVGNNPAYIVLVTSSPQSSLHTVYYFDATRLELVSYKSWAKMDAVCVNGNELIYVSCDGSLSNCSIKGAVDMKDSTTYASLSLRLFLSRVTSIEVYGNYFIVLGESSQTPGLAVALAISEGALLVPGIPLSFGQRPRIIKKQSGKQFAVILSNSMCINAAHVNNNNFNKCTFFKEQQFSSLKNVPGIITLMQFTIQNLIKNTKIISPCHPSILLTKILIGQNSDVVELSSLGSYLISTLYVRVQNQDLSVSIFCGGSNFDKQYKYKIKSSILTTMQMNKKVLLSQ